jgi:hypothetical protein
MDPERLSRASNDPMERRLLGAGRAGAPRTAKGRAMVAAAAAATAAELAGGQAAAGGALAKLGAGAGVKWIAIACIASAGAVAGEVWHERSTTSAGAAVARSIPNAEARLAPPVPAPQSTPVEPAPTPTPVPAASDNGSASIALPSPSRRVNAARTPEVSGASTMAEELAWLDRARAAIAAKDPARGLALLDGYAEHFARPEMLPEATTLRIEALADAGDRPAAERAATAFLASHPQSPYRARIRSLLGTSIP